MLDAILNLEIDVNVPDTNGYFLLNNYLVGLPCIMQHSITKLMLCNNLSIEGLISMHILIEDISLFMLQHKITLIKP